MANVSNKRKIQLIVDSVEITLKAPVAKAQAITELLMDIDACTICSGTFKLSKQQYAEFASKSIHILYR